MDDTWLYEIKQIIGPNQIQKSLNTVDELSNHTKGDDMRVNTSKTKHLPIHLTLQPNATVQLTLNNDSLEKVKVAKLFRSQDTEGPQARFTCSEHSI